MLLLIEYYKKYTETHELKPTTNILKWTNQYKEDTDIYLQFLNEYTEESDNDKDRVHCSDLYCIFKDLFKFNNPNTKIPSNKAFIGNIKKYKEIEKIKINNIPQLGIRKIKIVNLNNE